MGGTRSWTRPSAFLVMIVRKCRLDPKARVLLVEAVREVAELMARFLNTRGSAATTALNGQRVHPSIDAVVLDMLLPDKGGMEIMSAFSRQRRRPALILTSPVADSELAQNARRPGAFDFMTKPIDLQALEIDLVAS